MIDRVLPTARQVLRCVGFNNLVGVLVALEMTLSVDGESFLVFLWLVVQAFWCFGEYFTLGGCMGPEMSFEWASKWLLWLAVLREYFSLEGCAGPVSDVVGRLCPSLSCWLLDVDACCCTAECSIDLSTSLWVFLRLRRFLPMLWLVEVSSSALVGFSVSILLLWAVPWYISLWEDVVVLFKNISLWEGVLVLKWELLRGGSLSFLVTEATCLLHLGALLVHSTLMRSSQLAVAWLIRILASSLSTT